MSQPEGTPKHSSHCGIIISLMRYPYHRKKEYKNEILSFIGRNNPLAELAVGLALVRNTSNRYLVRTCSIANSVRGTSNRICYGAGADQIPI